MTAISPKELPTSREFISISIEQSLKVQYWFPMYGPQNINLSIPRKLARNEKSQVPPDLLNQKLCDGAIHLCTPKFEKPTDLKQTF